MNAIQRAFLSRALILVFATMCATIAAAFLFLETWFDIEIHIAILFLAGTTLLSGGWFWIIRPMGELIRTDAETKNRDFKARFNSMIDNMKEGVVVIDGQGVTQWNRSLFKMFELSEKQIRKLEIFPAGWRVAGENGLPIKKEDWPTSQCLRLGVPISCLMGLHKPNGDMVWIQSEASPVFAERTARERKRNLLPKVLAVVGTYRDITIERQALDRFELAMKAVKLGVWDWDIVANTSKWDDALCKMFGVERNAHIVESFIDYIIPEDRDRAKRIMELALFECGDASLEFRIRRGDGKIRVIRSESKGFYSPQGKPLRHVGVNWDITEQREQEIRVLQASKMSSLGEMSAGIAHEINNPLAIIIGKAESMQDVLAKPETSIETLKKHAEVIERTGHRIAKIVRSLRAFSRDGNQDPFEDTNVGDLVRETFVLCNSRFLNHGIELTLSDIDEKLMIRARAVEISQVLLNLMNNAFDACSKLEEKWVRVEVTGSGGAVEISVTDSGQGIPVEIREKITQPFFTTKEVGQGTGLGLSIATGIAQSHKGTLFIDPSFANTRIVLRIPRQSPPGNKVA